MPDRSLRPVTLDDQDVEAIAQRVAELLRGESARYLDAAGIAKRFGVGRSWVYAHKHELGAVRLGTGPKARLRFDVRRVESVLAAERDPAAALAEPRPSRRAVRGRAPARPVLDYESRERAA